ncbi:MAG: bifunctional diaminohydroxyphosphoribosylaminopyrimidine deaminase/5-amino-6-(5-phosphoribosylamino)uracil reductase RibD [Bacteroidales bacterium]|jgi:diaminohydroxyphosphoribosylaminopyrimidine deaminase/5-amino-6-(5-phosphoribosylamino)uracil reductase|nr:bifunctional diaminohydroxyphosphoribosylaminopyrimidine deaminase/5-amino-6-(5-phosphoribosylamino)uracil reductase RibD [Bacteroidales bacterium]
MAFVSHEKYMNRCIQLALNGKGNTSPNPMVGCVIVHNDVIIGEGFHRKAGEPHAEVNAINNVRNKELLKESTLYVNLEPCSHFGKTPPCANLIVDLKIPNVVIGTKDTAAHVSGKGIEILRNAGCNVQVGVLEKESRELNKRFFTFHEKKRPYIILKWAETKDGFIDIDKENKIVTGPTWITNQLSKTLVHKWRAEEDAILIGTNTVCSDNPSLTTREWFGKNPRRIVLDPELQLQKNFNVFNNEAETILIADINSKNQKKNELNSKIGTEFVNFSSDFINQLNSLFVKYKLQSIIIEGGAKTHQYFIDNEYWDEARVFIGDKLFGSGIKAPLLNKEAVSDEKLGNSKLFLFFNS